MTDDERRGAEAFRGELSELVGRHLAPDGANAGTLMGALEVAGWRLDLGYDDAVGRSLLKQQEVLRQVGDMARERGVDKKVLREWETRGRQAGGPYAMLSLLEEHMVDSGGPLEPY